MILDSIADILPGLMPASFRGVPFFVPDASSAHGRRVAEYLFPGTDRAAYDDFGLAPATITVEGIMVGDDYIAQARALQAAFERPGPGTLMHPWLGAMVVILSEPGEISFSATELRVARFSVSFKRALTAFAFGFGGGLFSTASLLLSSVLALASAARSMARAPAIVTLSQARTLATQRSYRLMRSAWTVQPAGQAGAAIRAALSPTVPSAPQNYAAAMAGVSDALLSSVPAIAGEPAVAPAGEAPAITGIDARAALDLCLDVAAAIELADAPSSVDRAMVTAAAIDALATAVRVSAYASFASRQDASAMRTTLVSRLDSLAVTCGELHGSSFAVTAGQVSRALAETRLRTIADLNEVIGRLPSVIVLNTDADVDAFQVANHLYGDTPSMIEDGYLSILARNRPRHPARLPAGRVEALK